MQGGGTEPPTKPKGRPRKYPPPDASADDAINSPHDITDTSSIIECDLMSDHTDSDFEEEDVEVN